MDRPLIKRELSLKNILVNYLEEASKKFKSYKRNIKEKNKPKTLNNLSDILFLLKLYRFWPIIKV